LLALVAVLPDEIVVASLLPDTVETIGASVFGVVLGPSTALDGTAVEVVAENTSMAKDMVKLLQYTF